MNTKEFIKAMIGKPWVNRASSFESVDCFGMIMLYYKHVLNIELPTVNGYEDKGCTIESGWHDNVNQWVAVDKPTENGLVFTCYHGGQPSHVGLVISPTHVLHSRGSEKHHGKVEMHSIRAIERLYGKITYHKYIGTINA